MRGAEAERGEKAWGWGAAARGRNAPARAGNWETSLFLRRLRVKEVWERKLWCKHR